MTGNGCNINNNLVSALSTVFINNNGAWLFGGNALGKFDTNKVTTQFSGVAQDFTFEFTLQKTNTIGSGTYYVFEIGGSGSPAYNTNKTYVLYNGNAGDTAVTFSMKLTDDSGTARTYNTPAFDWSDNARRSFAFSVTGGKIYWLTNGTLVNAGGTAFNYAMWQANYALAIGNKTNPTGSCIGYLDEIRYSSAGLYTGNYSVSALPLAYKTDGYAFTPVYDTYTTNAATIVYGGTIPAGCAVVPLHRLATSATDQSFSSGDFSSGTSFGRYHQWAIHLTGNGTSTPTVTQFSVRIL